MKKLSDAGDLVSLTQLKSMLEQEGIPCLIKNELMIGLSGEVPLNECSPQLWVADDKDESRARQLMHEFRTAEIESGPGWLCENCNEAMEGQFTSCWKCGACKPGTSEETLTP